MKRIAIVFALVTALAAPAGASADALSPGDFKNQSKYCKALRRAMGEGSFRVRFGTNKNRRNAHGKCVSQHVALEDAAPPSPPADCPTEEPLPVHAIAVGDCPSEPAPVSAFGTAVAQPPDGNGKGKHAKKVK